MKLYLWKEGLWHKCFNGQYEPGPYTVAEYKCHHCGFINPNLEILIPFLDRYAKAMPNIRNADFLNCYYYTHAIVQDRSNFIKERIEIVHEQALSYR